MNEQRLKELEALANKFSEAEYDFLFCTRQIASRTIAPTDNAIWSVGASSKPRITAASLEIGILGLGAIPELIAEMRRLREVLETIAQTPTGDVSYSDPQALVKLARDALKGE